MYRGHANERLMVVKLGVELVGSMLMTKQVVSDAMLVLINSTQFKLCV